MNKEIIGATIGTGVSAVGTGLQTNQILQTISLVLTILGSLITIGMALLNWWRNAKKDGKITEDEIKEGLDIINDGAKDLGDKLSKEDKKDDIQGKD